LICKEKVVGNEVILAKASEDEKNKLEENKLERN
jgi:hypothetical protein